MDHACDFPIEEAVSLLKEYSWLAEFRIVDFITTQYWKSNKNIPEEWRRFVEEDLDVEGFAVTCMQLAGFPLNDSQNAVFSMAKKCYECSFALLKPDSTDIEVTKRRNVKEKKTYEIEILAKKIGGLLKRDSDLKNAVDVGAGQGYLAIELLKEMDDLQVTAVEYSDVQVHGTMTRLTELTEDIRNRIDIKQVYLRADKKGSEFDSLVFPDTKAKEEEIPEYLMYSLHACGSLSECMLQIYSDPTCKAEALFNIACCYNLIDSSLPGCHFPLSQKVNTLWTGMELTRNMKMVACQAPYRWEHKAKQTRTFFKRHFYRSLIEYLVVQELGDVEPGVWLERVGNISDADLVDFPTYAMSAYKNMGMNCPDREFLINVFVQYKGLEKAMAFMWTMRALLGPPMEAVILYDRYAYLKDRLPNAKHRLEVVFDILKSPRNMALISIK